MTAAPAATIESLIAQRDDLVRRLEKGQEVIRRKQAEGLDTTILEETWIIRLHEYETITDELHSLAPQLAMEAYTQSLKAAAPAKSNGARPNR